MITATNIKKIIYQGNTQLFTLTGLQDKVTGDFINNNGTLQVTLVDDQGTSVPGCIEIVMSYLSGTDGNYQGIFGDSDFYPPIGTGYTLLVDGEESGSYIHLELLAEIQSRKS